jgi:hypothetical protein
MMRMAAVALACIACSAHAAPTRRANVNGQSADAIKSAVAKEEGVDAAGLECTILDGAAVSGLTVFRCQIVAKRTQRTGAYVGVIDGAGQLVLDSDEALKRVLQAWGYGAKRSVSAVDVARVAGFLEGEREPAHPILTQHDLDGLDNPEWRKLAALPREITVGGKPGVEYWNRSGRPPLWRTQLLVNPDGTPDATVKSIGQLLDP